MSMSRTGYRREDVEFTCQVCGHEFDGQIIYEYGTSTSIPEECPGCGSYEIEGEPVDPDERRL